MEQDPFFIYGPNGRAVAVILDQAAEMSLDQIAATAKSSESTTGYLGLRRSWRSASRALQEAAARHSRTTALSTAKDDAMNRVIEAVRRIVLSNQKSDEQIAECWQDYLGTIAKADPRPRRRAYRKLQRALSEGIGSASARSVPLASGAASTATQVAVVWDLANERSAFGLTDRDLLMSPWLTAFPLPPDLAPAS